MSQQRKCHQNQTKQLYGGCFFFFFPLHLPSSSAKMGREKFMSVIIRQQKPPVLFLCETCEIPKFGLQSVCEFMIIHSRDAAAGRSPGETVRLTSTKSTVTLWCLYKQNKTKKKMQNRKAKHSETNHFLRCYTRKIDEFQTQFYEPRESLKCFTPIFSWHNLTCESYFTLDQIVPVWVPQVKTNNLDRFISQYTDD